MTGRRALVAGLAVVIIAGLAAAWMLVGPGREIDARGDMDEGSALAPGDSPLDFTESDTAAGASDESLAAPDGGDVNRERPEAGGKPRADTEPPPPGGNNPPPPPDPDTSSLPPAGTGETINRAGPVEQPGTPGVPSSARDPTAREAAARARYRDPASLPRAASLPPTAKTESEQLPLDMSKLAESEVWAEYWSREGYTPPAMVKTPVRGKVMSLLTNTQVPGAKVRIFTFFPQAGLGGPLLPVSMECIADAEGFFTCNLPTPQRWPSDYPQYALSFEFEDRRIVDCAPFNNLRAGEHNEIGVFWAPEEPYELEVSANAPETGLTVASTGRIDPRRWQAARARAIFPMFGPKPLSATGSQLIGTWDIINDPPFVTLLRSGTPVLTRQCVRSLSKSEALHDPAADSADIGTPFNPVIFANDGTLALSGTVADGDGVAIEGASLTLTTYGGTRITYSDSTGWFSFVSLTDDPLYLVATHDLFVPRRLSVAQGSVDIKVELVHRRPKAVLVVTDAETDAPVTEVWIGGIVLPNAYEPLSTFGNRVTMQPLHLTAADGRYAFESEFALSELHIQAHGYRFVGLTNEQVLGDVDVSMTPGEKLERRPRDYDAAQTPELFHADEGEGPGLWSLDDDHWVEYAFDLGSDVTTLDLLLGVTNHTYGTLPLDNEYLFDVDVWVDGNKVGRMQIASDPNVQQIGRLRLGGLTGQVTIRLMWMNDRYIPGQLDANIRYESIRLMEVP